MNGEQLMSLRIREQILLLGLLLGWMVSVGIAQRNTGTILGTATAPMNATDKWSLGKGIEAKRLLELS